MWENKTGPAPRGTEAHRAHTQPTPHTHVHRPSWAACQLMPRTLAHAHFHHRYPEGQPLSEQQRALGEHVRIHPRVPTCMHRLPEMQACLRPAEPCRLGLTLTASRLALLPHLPGLLSQGPTSGHICPRRARRSHGLHRRGRLTRWCSEPRAGEPAALGALALQARTPEPQIPSQGLAGPQS